MLLLSQVKQYPTSSLLYRWIQRLQALRFVIPPPSSKRWTTFANEGRCGFMSSGDFRSGAPDWESQPSRFWMDM